MTDDSLIHYEVEPNYAGWTLAAYVAEKLKRPLPPDRLDRLLRGRALVHTEAELLPHTKIWPGLRFSLRKRSPGDSGEPPHVPVIYEDEHIFAISKPAGVQEPRAEPLENCLQRHGNLKSEGPAWQRSAKRPGRRNKHCRTPRSERDTSMNWRSVRKPSGMK